MKKLALLALALILVPASAHATLILGTPASVAQSATPWGPTDVNVAGFDNDGGSRILDAVTVTLIANLSDTWALLNTSNQAQDVTSLALSSSVVANGFAGSGVSGLTAVATDTVVPPTIILGAGDSDSGSGTPSKTVVFNVSAADFANYITLGDLTFALNAPFSVNTFASSGNINFTPTNLVGGSLEVDYHYHTNSEVPEPASLSLIGMGLSGFGLLRRRYGFKA